MLLCGTVGGVGSVLIPPDSSGSPIDQQNVSSSLLSLGQALTSCLRGIRALSGVMLAGDARKGRCQYLSNGYVMTEYTTTTHATSNSVCRVLKVKKSKSVEMRDCYATHWEISCFRFSRNVFTPESVTKGFKSFQ